LNEEEACCVKVHPGVLKFSAIQERAWPLPLILNERNSWLHWRPTINSRANRHHTNQTRKNAESHPAI
jgi:hypothetical protein